MKTIEKEDKLRIIHVMNYYIPGMGYQENFLISEQKKLGHHVEIITSDRLPPFEDYHEHIGKLFQNRIVGQGILFDQDIKINRLPCIYESKKNKEVLLKGLKQKLNELKPDIVHAHGAISFPTIQVVLISKKNSYKVFIDDHCDWESNLSHGFLNRLYLFMLKLLYRSFSSRIGCFLPVGRASSDVLIKILDIPSRKIEFLFLGADTTRFRKSVKLRNEGRAELHITDHDILIITSGKFHKNRDIDVLLNSFALISEKIPCLKLLLLGGGSKNYMDKLHSEVKDQHLIDRVIFHEFVSHNELPKFYNAADIGIWPGWPSITVNEAIACGLPVIVPRDFLQYHHLFENFVVLGFKRGDSQELAEKILCFIDNEDQRQMIIKNAESFFKTTISWEAIAKKSIQIYSKYLPEKRIQ